MMPFRYGNDFLSPKFAPDERRNVLLGPGVTDVTKLNTATETNKPQVMFRV
jgi:hypothetical protein